MRASTGQPSAERKNPTPWRERWIGLVLVVGVILLSLLGMEGAFRLLDKPAAINSGWRATQTPIKLLPVHELGWRGRPIRYQPDDFVVVLLGDSQVECRVCPADETMDLILERALQQFMPKVRVISLGAAGYGTDQEYLALQEYFSRYRADLIVTWVTIYNDIINNITRSAGGGYHRFHPKPTFWLENAALRGPTEAIDGAVFTGKLRVLWHRAFEDFEQQWAYRLPPPTRGMEEPPSGMDRVVHTAERLDEQRSIWSILQTPRPARMQYGIALTRALLERMRALAQEKDAGFAVMMEDSQAPASAQQAQRLGLEVFLPGKTAVVQAGQWFMADSAVYAATVQEVAAGFPFLHVPIRMENPRISPVDNHFVMPVNRQVMADLAAMLAAQPALIPAARLRRE